MKLSILNYPLSMITLLTAASCQNSGIGNLSGGKSAPSLDLSPHRTSTTNYSISNSAGVETLVRSALSHHPSLIAAQQNIIRLQAKVPQAESLPDPKAKISSGRLAETAAGRVTSTIGAEQAIPFPGKRRAKAATAQKEADAARAELSNLRLRLAERVRLAYWTYYLANQNLRIDRESRDILTTIQEIVTARIAANQATQFDLLRITTEISKVDQKIISAKQQNSSAKATLNSLLNRPAGARLPYPKRSSVPTAGSLNSLIARAESSHPSIRANQSKLNAFRYRLKSAQLDKYPDFLIGVQHGFVSDSGLSPVSNGRDQSMLTLGVTIPLWQKPRRAKIDAANAGIAEMQATVSSSRADLRQRVEDAYFRAKSSREMITLFDQRLIPDAKQAHELSLQSYSAGNSTFIDVLDTWRLLLKFQLQQEANRASLGKASANLKSAANLK